MQLHGPAKSLQLAKMSYENKARRHGGQSKAVRQVTRREIRKLSGQVGHAVGLSFLAPDGGGLEVL